MDNNTMQHHQSTIAEAIRSCFISPNVSDSNGEAANVVDSLNRIASAIFDLAEAIRNERPSEKEDPLVDWLGEQPISKEFVSDPAQSSHDPSSVGESQ